MSEFSLDTTCDAEEATALSVSATAAAATQSLAALNSEASTEQVDAFATLSKVLEKEPRHGIRGAMVKDFFAGGNAEGPFAGSRSAQGEYMASTFYVHARPFGGAFATERPSQYSESGYKLQNYDRVG
jgi:hypothetical protein